MKPCKITVDLYNTFRERMPEYVQYDRNVPLEITVLENGKPADLNGLFGRLLVSKPDGHEVYSNDVEINGNVITTTLGEQVFTASGVAQVTVDILDEQNSKRALVPFGMRIRSAVITNESIKSSNDYQTITALISDVRALNAMFHVEQEQRAEAFNAQMQSQEATFTEAQRQFLADHREAMFHVEQQTAEQADMFHVEQTKRAKAFEQSEADREQRFEAQTTEWAQTVEQAEATRQFNEERRQSAENKRESAEKARESAERQRVDTEAVRQRQEQERSQGEAGRATTEANRVKAEQTRVDNESSRKSAESSRVNAESQRATAEGHRATAETSRATAETNRATAETNRAGAEGRRSEAESSRVTAENNRVTAESKRVTAENTRETQESARREAEEDRATRMAQWEAKAEETAQKAQEAVDSAQAFVNTNEERLLTDRDMVDYMGNQHESLKAKNDADVDWLLGEINTAHYEGQHITANDTIEGRAKSAILTGQTLVNTLKTTSLVTSHETYLISILFFEYVLPSGDYIILLPHHINQEVRVDINLIGGGWVKSFSNKSESSKSYIKFTLEDGQRVSQIYGSRADGYTEDNSKALTNIMVLKYQDGMENWDIPYFEGMTSVKMPVLTTTGKNLFDKEAFYNDWKSKVESYVYKEIVDNEEVLKVNNFYHLFADDKGFRINVEKGVPLTLRMECKKAGTESTNTVFTIRYGDDIYKSFPMCKSDEWQTNTTTFVPTRDYITFCSGYNNDGYYYVKNIQLEENSTSTTYEPFKSNILTVNEDVTLRGVGDVKDELNPLTGELTERIGEIVLDGSEIWSKESTNNVSGDTGTTTCYYTSINDIKLQSHCAFACKELPYRKVTLYHKINDYEGISKCLDDKRIFIRINQSRLTEQNVNGFKQWLSQNPITIQYELATPTVKTVDLSDNHVYSYKDVTHYDCSSAEGSLVPTLSIDVPTNLPAVVARQRATIQELEKENVALKTAVTIVDEHREEGDLELLSSDFDFELRLMEIEFAVGIPMMANYKGVRNMARTPYDMAKALILGGKYEREEMMTKLDRFEKLGSITADQKAELIALMDAVELTQ